MSEMKVWRASLSRRDLLYGTLAVAGASLLSGCSSQAATPTAEALATSPTPDTTPVPTGAPSPTIQIQPTASATPPPIFSPTPQVTATVAAPNSLAINQFLAQLGNWEPAVVNTTDARKLETGSVAVNGQTYDCVVDTKSQTTTQKVIVAAGSGAGALWPGAVIQGQDIASGNLLVLPLARAPITLSINLAISDPTITVDDPYSGSVQEAISTLQRAADQRLGGIDVVPATMSYVREEAYSFNQAMLSIGISANYAAPFAGAGLDTSFSRERQVGAHTIIVKFYQPMYTIQIDDDRVATPSDLFASTVSVDDFKQQQALGRLAPNNPPVLVKSVTYGRMMVFTMTSTQVESAQRLMAAINAVFGNFSGSAKVAQSDLDIIRNSRIDMKVFGGQQESALAAIRSGDLSQFFTRADAANAVPLTFQAQRLNGQPIEVKDAATFQAQTCTKRAAPKPSYNYTVRLSKIDTDAYVYVNGALIKHQVGGSTTVDVNSHMGAGNNTLEIVLGNANCFASSLDLAIDVNGVQQVTRGYSVSVATCGFQLNWKYTINRDTGVVKKIS